MEPLACYIIQVLGENTTLRDAWESGVGGEGLIARAIFDNDQTNSGWMYLEISTKESADDYLQVLMF